MLLDSWKVLEKYWNFISFTTYQLCDVLGICRACKIVRFAVIPFHVKSSTTSVCSVMCHRFKCVSKTCLLGGGGDLA